MPHQHIQDRGPWLACLTDFGRASQQLILRSVHEPVRERRNAKHGLLEE